MTQAAPPPDTTSDADAAEIRRLAGDASAYVDAWRELFAAEVALARQNLGALAIAAFALPALLLAVWLSTVGLAVVALHEGGLGWLSAAAIGCAAQLCFLYLLILRARRWLRELALTHSRFAVQQLLERVR